MSAIVNFTLNGNPVSALASPEMTLLELLREGLGLANPKCGCNHGDCGACTIALDGKAVKSCLVLALTIEGKSVTTIDGIACGTELHPVQKAFHAYGAPQCGYCTPGMVMAAVTFLDKNPTPTPEQVQDALSGNLCRCGGYQKYIDAVIAASKGEFGPLPKGCEQNV